MEVKDNEFANSILQKNKSLPIAITIKNVTDDKVYNVDLFSLEKNPKLIFGTKYNDETTYDDVVREMNTKISRFFLVKQFAFCEYKKFESKQLYCNLKIYEHKEGEKDDFISNTRIFIIDPYQSQNGISTLCLNQDEEIAYHKNVKLILDFIMPDTEITLLFYPKTVENGIK